MATVVNQNQQVYTAGLTPVAAYSRIVSIELLVYHTWDWVYVVTPVIGNNVWLLGVDVVSELKAIDGGQFSNFDIYAGGGKDVALDDIRQWEKVLPLHVYSNVPTSWRILDGSPGFKWVFKKYYAGNGRRFAMVARRWGEDMAMLFASFHISEG